jgi:serine/threonine protein kinase/Flp pilus assembly protein TadD
MDPISPERFRWADALFDAALDLPTSERAAFVDQECGEDADLRTSVGRLLDAHGHADHFLGRPAAEIAAPLLDPSAFPRHSSTPPIPPRVGPFRIIREIGHGGMGTVYLAERAGGEFRQRVALKLIRGGIATEYLVRRFVEERRILASLEHPGIARLIDGGITADGMPYFAMEYVEGVPIDRYCDEHRLSIEQRLELFCAVCDAVQHAHRNLVVHRDLKPSNVLVTEDRGVKLLDFGIAKLLGAEAEEGHTGTGIRLMTPEYASPEQIRGEAVTTASDVYALGVLLYELLTGQHPFRRPGLSRKEVERQLLEMEPERPSTAVVRPQVLARGGTPALGLRDPGAIVAARGSAPERLRRRLRGDLDTIILKAIHREPERRYVTAEHLTADLRRHLSGLPVEARPDTWGYRAGTFLRRNRLAVAAGAAFVLVLAGFSVVATVQATRIQAQAERAAQAHGQTERLAALLLEVFTLSDPERARGQSVTARELLDRGVERVERDLAGDPEIQARMLETMGMAFRGLGSYDRARTLLERALVIRRRLHPGDHADLAVTLYNLAMVLRFQGEFEPAERHFREALAMRRRLFGDRHPAVVESLNGLGFVLRGRGADAEAESLYREALASGRAVHGRPHLEIADALNGLGVALSDRGSFEDAVQAFREALEMYRALVGEEHPETGVVLLNLGRTFYRKGDLQEAEVYLRQAVDVSRRVQGDRHPVYALNLTMLADVLRGRRALREAESLYRLALEIQRAALAPKHANTASTLLGLGRLLMDRNRDSEAEPMLREALAIREEALVAKHWGIGLARSTLGTCLSRLGREAEAEPLLLDGFAYLGEALGIGDPRTQSALRQLVDHYERAHRPGRAAHYRAALTRP